MNPANSPLQIATVYTDPAIKGEIFDNNGVKFTRQNRITRIETNSVSLSSFISFTYLLFSCLNNVSTISISLGESGRSSTGNCAIESAIFCIFNSQNMF